jgi:hypothetical protein
MHTKPDKKVFIKGLFIRHIGRGAAFAGDDSGGRGSNVYSENGFIRRVMALLDIYLSKS